MSAAAVVKQGSTLIQSVDWTRFSVEEWLEQYGLWVNDQRDKGVQGYGNVFAGWLSTQQDRRRREHKLSQCMLAIDDNEARAVGRLLADLKQADKQVGHVVSSHIEYSKPFASIAAQSMGEMSPATACRRHKDGIEYLRKRMGL